MSKRILFVDDEPLSVSAYFEILEDQNIEIDLAEDGNQAINRLQSQKYDLVVLDVQFTPGEMMGENIEPRRAGAELLALIRKNKIVDLSTPPNVPILILTAVMDQRLLEEIKDLKVDGLCSKPIVFQKVVETVTRLLGIEPAS